MGVAIDIAFDLLIVKDFRFMGGFPNILMPGGYDMNTDEAFVNLSSRVEPSFRDMTTDKERMDRRMQILAHESTHQALNPPHTTDLWDKVSAKNLPDDISDEERARHQAKVNNDWERFQEYGAWSATPGIDEKKKWDMLSLYGIYPKGGEQ